MSARFGGIPTDVDVNALIEAYGVPAPGWSADYSAVAEIAKAPARSNRFKTVTDAWRRRLYATHGVSIRARAGRFSVRSASERIGHAVGKTRSSLRGLEAARDEVAGTDRSSLSELQKAQADHVLMVSTTALQAARLRSTRKSPGLPGAIGAREELG